MIKRIGADDEIFALQRCAPINYADYIIELFKTDAPVPQSFFFPLFVSVSISFSFLEV